MKTQTWMAGAGALALMVVAVALALRPGNDPVAAVQPVLAGAASGTSSGEGALARLGNLQVTPQELQPLLDALPAEARARLREDRPALDTWIRGRLAQKAVLEQAAALGWAQRPEVERQTRAAIEQIVLRDYLESVSQVPADYPGEPELQQAYEAGKANWMTPPLYRVRQIFLAVPQPQAADTVRKQAQELARRAQAAPGEFAALARQYSQDPGSAERGGDTGLQPLQQLLPQVREALARLKVGAVAEPIQSPAGFHIVKLDELQPARSATLDELRDRLREALRAQRQEQIAKAYLDGMLNTATLSIDGAALNKLVQASQ